MMKVFWALLVCFLSVINNALADNANMTQAMNFGSVRLSNPQNSAIVVLGSDGTYGTQTNIATSSGQKNGIVRYERTGWFSLPTITAITTSTGNLECSTPATCSGCSVSFDNLTVNPASHRFSLLEFDTNFNYGGRITIPANCGYGTFEGALTINYRSSGSGTPPSPSLTVNLVIDPQPVNVQSTQDLSFGAVLSTVTHDVVVSPNGSRQSSAYVINDSSYPPTNGIIKISKEEAGSRTVTVAVDSQTSISNGGTSLTVDLVTDLPTSSITLTSKDTYINVGGTLHVTQGAPAGEYNGTYRIEVTY